MSAGGQGVLVVNPKFANARSVEGLARVVLAPRGVDVKSLECDDLAVYRRGLRWLRLRSVQHMMSDQRVSTCYRVRYKPSVELWRSERSRRAFYAGVRICGSVWSCPVCASKITERRKLELENAPRSDDFYKLMATYTLQHHKADKLSGLVADLANGLRDMKNSRGYKNLVKRLGVVGSVTGQEITISNVNGWHPHKHALMFAERAVPADEVREELSKLFVDAMKKRGRYVSAVIGVDVRSENVVASYVAKMGLGEKESRWSLSAEIAKSPVKAGHDEDHFHPFELIDMYQAGNMQAGKYFMQYARAMKGVNQLRYTSGLRALLGMDADMSDQEIAEHMDNDSALFALISAGTWKIILQHEKRGQLLEIASHGNMELLRSYLRTIGGDM